MALLPAIETLVVVRWLIGLLQLCLCLALLFVGFGRNNIGGGILSSNSFVIFELERSCSNIIQFELVVLNRREEVVDNLLVGGGIGESHEQVSCVDEFAELVTV